MVFFDRSSFIFHDMDILCISRDYYKGTGSGLETGTSGAEAGKSGMPSSLTTCEERISNRRTPMSGFLTLDLSYRGPEHQARRLENWVQPQVLLWVADTCEEIFNKMKVSKKILPLALAQMLRHVKFYDLTLYRLGFIMDP